LILHTIFLLAIRQVFPFRTFLAVIPYAIIEGTGLAIVFLKIVGYDLEQLTEIRLSWSRSVMSKIDRLGAQPNQQCQQPEAHSLPSSARAMTAPQTKFGTKKNPMIGSMATRRIAMLTASFPI
jgi:hypothetical protein